MLERKPNRGIFCFHSRVKFQRGPYDPRSRPYILDTLPREDQSQLRDAQVCRIHGDHRIGVTERLGFYLWILAHPRKPKSQSYLSFSYSLCPLVHLYSGMKVGRLA